MMLWPLIVAGVMTYCFGGFVQTLGIFVLAASSIISLPLILRWAWLHREVEFRSHQFKKLRMEGARQ